MNRFLVDVLVSILSGLAVWIYDHKDHEPDKVKELTHENDSLKTVNKARTDSLIKVAALYHESDSIRSVTLKDTLKTHEKQRTVLLTHAALPVDSATRLFLDRSTGHATDP